MIAWTGLLEYKSGNRIKVEDSKINSRWRIDEVNITWS